MRLAEKFGSNDVIIAGDISRVYDRDPKKHSRAKAIKDITWNDYQKLIPSKWTPGMSSPVDPVATELAKKVGLTAKILKGSDLDNFKEAVQGNSFKGTVIHS